MKGFFNSDSALMRFLSTLGDLIIINCLFLICAIPIITIGPACTAVYKTMYTLSENNGDSIPKLFFASFKEGFKESTIIWCGGLVCVLLLLLHFFLITICESVKIKAVLFFIWFFAVFFLAGFLSYIFALIAHYRNSIWQYIHNAILLTIGCFPRTIVLVGINTFPLLLLLFSTAVFFYLIPIWLLFGFAFISRLSMCCLKPIFLKLDQRAV